MINSQHVSQSVLPYISLQSLVYGTFKKRSPFFGIGSTFKRGLYLKKVSIYRRHDLNIKNNNDVSKFLKINDGIQREKGSGLILTIECY